MPSLSEEECKKCGGKVKTIHHPTRGTIKYCVIPDVRKCPRFALPRQKKGKRVAFIKEE